MARVVVLPQPLLQLRQRRLQLAVQGVGRVDDEHAAGRQARANGLAFHVLDQLAALDGQCGIEPRAAGPVGQGLELFGQVMGLWPRNERVPDGVGAGGKALEGFADHRADPAIVGLHLVTGVADDQCSARGRRQQRAQGLKAVLHGAGHAAAQFELSHIARQRPKVGGMQFKQFELMAPGQKLRGDEG